MEQEVAARKIVAEQVAVKEVKKASDVDGKKGVRPDGKI